MRRMGTLYFILISEYWKVILDQRKHQSIFVDTDVLRNKVLLTEQGLK